MFDVLVQRDYYRSHSCFSVPVWLQSYMFWRQSYVMNNVFHNRCTSALDKETISMQHESLTVCSSIRQII